MTEPTTAAAKKLSGVLFDSYAMSIPPRMLVAIEAEAAAAARTALLDELEAAVEEMRSAYADTDGSRQPRLIEKRDVLHEISRRRA